MNNILSGKQGEELAQKYLESKGYTILEKNYRYKRGEIDLIAKQNDQLLVFVEVKARKKGFYGNPEEAVGFKKEEIVLSTAEHYIFDKNWLGQIRFDIIAILNNDLQHFEDAFGY